VIERSGPLSYIVQVRGEQAWKRHIDHLREVGDTPLEQPTEQISNDNSPPVDESFPIPSQPEVQTDSTEPSSSQIPIPNVDNQPTAVTHCYPCRKRQPPKRFRT